jgi:uncharacterized protein
MSEALTLALDERLANPGDTMSVAGHLDWPSYDVGVHHMELDGGVDYDIVLTNAGDGILATGLAKAHATGACDRCLEPAQLDLTSEVNEYFLFEAPSEDELGEDEDEVDFSLVASDNTIDLGESIHAALVMDTPFVLLCKEDCRGLCPTCGCNLNEESCTCAATRAQQEAAEAEANNPFAVLKQLNVKDERTGRDA